MNIKHKDTLVRQQVDNICKLLDATVRYQSVYTPKGKPIERIVIEYEQQQD